VSEYVKSPSSTSKERSNSEVAASSPSCKL
jgi:hypothetical protein